MAPLDKLEGDILGRIKATAASTRGLAETASEQAERHFRQSYEATAMNNDLLIAQSAGNPDALVDMLEEAIESGRTSRALKVGLVIEDRIAGPSWIARPLAPRRCTGPRWHSMAACVEVPVRRVTTARGALQQGGRPRSNHSGITCRAARCSRSVGTPTECSCNPRRQTRHVNNREADIT